MTDFSNADIKTILTNRTMLPKYSEIFPGGAACLRTDPVNQRKLIFKSLITKQHSTYFSMDPTQFVVFLLNGNLLH